MYNTVNIVLTVIYNQNSAEYEKSNHLVMCFIEITITRTQWSSVKHYSLIYKTSSRFNTLYNQEL